MEILYPQKSHMGGGEEKQTPNVCVVGDVFREKGAKGKTEESHTAPSDQK